MKIVLMGPAHPLRGGIAQHMSVLYERMVRMGHDVHFVSFIKQFPNWLFPGKTQFDSSEQVIDVHPVPRFAPLGMRSWRRTYKEIAKYDADIAVFRWWMPFFGPGYWAVARWLRKNTRTKVLMLIDNAIPHERRPGDKFLTKLAFSQVDYFVAQSGAVERDLFEWFPDLERERVKMSPHPIYDCYTLYEGSRSQAREAIGFKPDDKVLLFFGFVRDYKGLDLLIDALPEIRKTHPNVKLMVVGEFYVSREEYDKKVRDAGCEDIVKFRDDYVPNEEVGVYFAAADCAVLPYRSASQSGIIQMAYALKLPVITTDVGGLSEVVEEGVTGYLVPPENPNDIAKAVDKYYSAGGRDSFEPKLMDIAGKFSWEGMVNTITSFKTKESA